MIEAVIFDFDETLSMTEEAYFHLENLILQQMGFPAMSRQIHQQTWGLYLDKALAKRAPDVNPQKFRKAQEPLRQEYIKNGKLDFVSEENLKVLDILAKQGKQLMLFTGRDGHEVEHLMDPKHHLGARISHFYHHNNNDYHKPDPKTFAIIERDHGLKPDECVYVGDSLSDAEAACGAGLHLIISLEGGLRKPSDFSDYPVDVFVHKLDEIPAAIKKNRTKKQQQNH